jgi:hypothetical protein
VNPFFFRYVVWDLFLDILVEALQKSIFTANNFLALLNCHAV